MCRCTFGRRAFEGWRLTGVVAAARALLVSVPLHAWRPGVPRETSWSPTVARRSLLDRGSLGRYASERRLPELPCLHRVDFHSCLASYRPDRRSRSAAAGVGHRPTLSTRGWFHVERAGRGGRSGTGGRSVPFVWRDSCIESGICNSTTVRLRPTGRVLAVVRHVSRAADPGSWDPPLLHLRAATIGGRGLARRSEGSAVASPRCGEDHATLRHGVVAPGWSRAVMVRQPPPRGGPDHGGVVR